MVILSNLNFSPWNPLLRRLECLWTMRLVKSPFMMSMLQLISNPLLAAPSLRNSTHSSVTKWMTVLETLLLWLSLLSITNWASRHMTLVIRKMNMKENMLSWRASSSFQWGWLWILIQHILVSSFSQWQPNASWWCDSEPPIQPKEVEVRKAEFLNRKILLWGSGLRYDQLGCGSHQQVDWQGGRCFTESSEWFLDYILEERKVVY